MGHNDVEMTEDKVPTRTTTVRYAHAAAGPVADALRLRAAVRCRSHRTREREAAEPEHRLSVTRNGPLPEGRINGGVILNLENADREVE